MKNFDDGEKSGFDWLASRWWRADGELKTLHDINPTRLRYIKERVDVAGETVLDIGCGGGLLTEALAGEGATVTGIDISRPLVQTASKHAAQQGYVIEYLCTTPEDFAVGNASTFGVITCMELLEHVSDPPSLISTCMRLIKPGGWLFLSTINRNLKAYLQTIIVAEYALKLLPVGTHDYRQYALPSEVSMWCRQAGFSVLDISGLSYIPWFGYACLKRSPDVNYLLCARAFEKS